jgi:phospholipid/cholesterol/gamma-HCH transport system substrate-binding protein
MQSQAAAAEGRAEDINDAFGNLPEFVAASEDITRELNAQADAFRGTIANTGHFFDALSERDGQLRALITETNRMFQVTARRNQDLAAIWRELPRFERESRLTLPRLTRFSVAAEPSVRQLQPVATAMGPAFDGFRRLGAEFKPFFRRLGPVISASKRGVPAFERTMKELPPLLRDFEPFLRNFNPMLRYLNLHRRELTAFLANATAATSARDLNLEANGRPITQPVHYIRAATPLAPESLTYYPRPLGYSRANAYAAPGTGSRLASGLPVGDTRGCANGDVAAPGSAEPLELQPLVQLYVFRSEAQAVARPGCTAQGPHPGFGTSFPRLLAEP